jgi:hypothetical protein
MICVIATLEVAEGRRDDFMAAFRQLVPSTFLAKVVVRPIAGLLYTFFPHAAGKSAHPEFLAIPALATRYVSFS